VLGTTESYRLQQLDSSNWLLTFPSGARASRGKTVLAAAADRGQAVPFSARWWGVGVEEMMEGPSGGGGGSGVGAGAGGGGGGAAAAPRPAGGGDMWATVARGWRDKPTASGGGGDAAPVPPVRGFKEAFGEE
jgi:hypothetical protein